MAEFTGRDLHLVKKALAIAVLTIEREPGPFQSASDQSDMKTLLDDMIEDDTELAFYARAARIAVTGEPD
ncbi:hypothetical protein ABIB75_006953 [Bradyrhizobium sp. GM2.2]|uniref:hypothetical protein n=1 Tax=unclassified Bradyrhizobium TaxID=2631580 RepID=UPI001FFAE102|nr:MULTISPECIES: hypothetical protein [unclassified Bradyrhizobium]MCK1349218.1 hypothetical protein [Bradyrhizobium sp. CW11]MCK1568779.1 hypothetical protein [Bradyrhizobium sp. 173]MCK1587894.1 hypothetical protein [Bradyrhizobium sp. 169]